MGSFPANRLGEELKNSVASCEVAGDVSLFYEGEIYGQRKFDFGFGQGSKTTV